MKGDEYVILHNATIEGLDEQINVYFFHGYLPDGDIVVSQYGVGKLVPSPLFIQRMKKKDRSGSYGYEQP